MKHTTVFAVLVLLPLAAGCSGGEAPADVEPSFTSQASSSPAKPSVTGSAPESISARPVIYEKGDEVFVIDSHGRGKRSLFTVASGVPLPLHGPFQEWAANGDGTRLAFIRPGDPFSSPEVHVMERDDGESRLLIAGDYVGVAWIGSDFVLVQPRDSSAELELYDFDGTRRPIRSFTPGTAPGVSPFIRFWWRFYFPSPENATVIGDPETGGEQTVSGHLISWSPDGSTAAFFLYPDTLKIWWRDSEITITTGDDFDPQLLSWSPDSSRVAYWIREDPWYTLVAADALSGSVIKLSRPGAVQNTGPLAWSPDGERVYFRPAPNAVFSAQSDGSGGTDIDPNSVRYCFTRDDRPVALDEVEYPGIQAISTKASFPSFGILFCWITDDLKYALHREGNEDGLYAVDLKSGMRTALAGGEVTFAAWTAR